MRIVTGAPTHSVGAGQVTVAYLQYARLRNDLFLCRKTDLSPTSDTFAAYKQFVLLRRCHILTYRPTHKAKYVGCTISTRAYTFMCVKGLKRF